MRQSFTFCSHSISLYDEKPFRRIEKLHFLRQLLGKYFFSSVVDLDANVSKTTKSVTQSVTKENKFTICI